MRFGHRAPYVVHDQAVPRLDQIEPGKSVGIGCVGIRAFEDADAHLVTDAWITVEIDLYPRMLVLELARCLLKKIEPVPTRENRHLDLFRRLPESRAANE